VSGVIRLDDLEAFVAIVEAGGQTAAARRLGRSLQSVARSLATLEAASGVELIRRNTRRSQPTEAGRAFLLRVAPALAEIEAAKREAAEVGAEPSGLLRIGAPVAFGAAHVVPVVREFLARHPRVEVELKASDQPLDPFEQRLDLAVRIRELPDLSLKSRRLGEMRAMVFGAPAYFAAHGRPQHPDDLARHQCIAWQSGAGGETWPFRVGGRPCLVRIEGRFRTDGTPAVHAAVAQGLGLGRAPLWQIRELLEQGLVEPVLEEFEAMRLPIQVVWPAARQPTAKVRLFVDALARYLKGVRL
jgi:DNA-binding transcriptional LysR family regulator